MKLCRLPRFGKCREAQCTRGSDHNAVSAMLLEMYTHNVTITEFVLTALQSSQKSTCLLSLLSALWDKGRRLFRNSQQIDTRPIHRLLDFFTSPTRDFTLLTTRNSRGALISPGSQHTRKIPPKRWPLIAAFLTWVVYLAVYLTA